MVEVGANNYIVHTHFTLDEIFMDKEEDRLATYFGEIDILDEGNLYQSQSQRIGGGFKSNGGRSRSNGDQDSEDFNDDDDDESSEDDYRSNISIEQEPNFSGLGVEIDLSATDFAPDQVIEDSKRFLIMVILSLIYMNEFPLSETELFNLLKEFGLPLDYVINQVHEGMFKLN